MSLKFKILGNSIIRSRKIIVPHQTIFYYVEIQK